MKTKKHRALKPAAPTPFVTVGAAVYDDRGQNIIGYGHSLRNVMTANLVARSVNSHRKLMKAASDAYDMLATFMGNDNDGSVGRLMYRIRKAWKAGGGGGPMAV